MFFQQLNTGRLAQKVNWLNSLSAVLCVFSAALRGLSSFQDCTGHARDLKILTLYSKDCSYETDFHSFTDLPPCCRAYAICTCIVCPIRYGNWRAKNAG